MKVDIVIPQVGESVTEATISTWLKKVGDPVDLDEPIVAIDTDKVSVEIPSPTRGVLAHIQFAEGETVAVGQVIGNMEQKEIDIPVKTEEEPASIPEEAPPKPELKPVETPKPKEEKAAPSPAAPTNKASDELKAKLNTLKLTPSAFTLALEKSIDPSGIIGTGRGGHISKWDIEKLLENKSSIAAKITSGSGPSKWPQLDHSIPRQLHHGEKRVAMSRLRQKIAERLVQVQHTAAILTTFNEIDMSAVIQLRTKHKEAYKKKYGVSLGFLSFFTKACVSALKHFPALNAEVDGTDIIYKEYFDIGVAVSTERGLVVPVVRNSDLMSFADLEMQIMDLAIKARDRKLSIDDLSGGTFTISNGGIFGSMLSTPLLNPPQVGILGMHNIVKRPVVIEDSIEIRPMMYAALSYDHRIVDGREAVQFLVHIKNCIEDPERIFLDL